MKSDFGDAVARLGIYQLASHEAFQTLLPYVINADSIPCVIICLDWSNPAGFVSSLHKWIKVIESSVKNVDVEESKKQRNPFFILSGSRAIC